MIDQSVCLNAWALLFLQIAKENPARAENMSCLTGSAKGERRQS
jgi:hypothetical protein